jgi:hypothetical protein
VWVDPPHWGDASDLIAGECCSTLRRRKRRSSQRRIAIEVIQLPVFSTRQPVTLDMQTTETPVPAAANVTLNMSAVVVVEFHAARRERAILLWLWLRRGRSAHKPDSETQGYGRH